MIHPKLPSVLTASEHVDMRSWPSAQQLEKFIIMDEPQLVCYFTRLVVGLVMPRLDIASLVDPIHTINYQTGTPGFTRAGMGPSCDYCIDLAIMLRWYSQRSHMDKRIVDLSLFLPNEERSHSCCWI